MERFCFHITQSILLISTNKTKILESLKVQRFAHTARGDSRFSKIMSVLPSEHPIIFRKKMTTRACASVCIGLEILPKGEGDVLSFHQMNKVLV